jgi:hypothetical protein
VTSSGGVPPMHRGTRVIASANVERGRLPGQIRIRIRFRDLVGPWMDYPMVSPDQLREIVDGTGWYLTETIDSDDTYIAVIEKAG